VVSAGVVGVGRVEGDFEVVLMDTVGEKVFGSVGVHGSVGWARAYSNDREWDSRKGWIGIRSFASEA